MKILHLYKSYYSDGLLGGVEEMIHQLSSHGGEFDTEHRIVTLAKEISNQRVKASNGAEIFYYKNQLEIASNPFSLPLLFNIKQHFEWADIIHYHFPWPFGDLVHFFGKYFLSIKKPTLVSYHSDIIKQRFLLKLYSPIQKHFLKSMDRIIPASENYAKTSEALQNFQDKLTIIPMGIEAVIAPPDQDKNVLQWEKELGKGFYLFIGALRYYKGLHLAIRALPPSVKFVIAGTGFEERNLKRLVKNLGLEKQVIFIGRVEEVDKWGLLKLCKAFLFPSHLRSEAFGISLLEACMMQRPMISCEIGSGNSFVNKNQETGITTEPNPNSLRKAINYFEKNPDQIKQWGKNARARYEKLFTAGGMAKSYHALYKQLVKNSVE